MTAKKRTAKKAVKKKASSKKAAPEAPAIEARGSFRQKGAQFQWVWDGEDMKLVPNRQVGSVQLRLIYSKATALRIKHPVREYKVWPARSGEFRFKLAGMGAGEELTIHPFGGEGVPVVG